MKQAALIVIDVQRGMFAFDVQPYDGDAVLARINMLVSRARQASIPVVFIQHDGGAGHPLEKPHANWAVHPATGYCDDDIIVEKQHCDAFQGTELQQLLADLKVKTLVLTGMMSEFCVDTTCRRAFSLGYKVVLASDSHTTISKPNLSAQLIVEHHNNILAGNFADLLPAANITFQPNEASQ